MTAIFVKGIKHVTLQLGFEVRKFKYKTRKTKKNKKTLETREKQ